MTSYRQISCAAVLALAIVTTMNAQDTSASSSGTGDALNALQDQTALLTAQTALLAAQKANLAAQAELESQKSAAATTAATTAAAARDARDQALVDAATTLAGAASKLPSGSQTVADDFKATPASTRLSMNALGETCGELAREIGPALQDKRVVFVDTIPGPVDTYAYQYFLLDAAGRETAIADLAKAAVQKGGPERVGLSEPVLNRLGLTGFVVPKMAIGAVAGLVAALPGAVGTLLGLFRSDTTEHAGTASNTAGTAAALFAREAGLTKVYPSVDAAAYSQFKNFDSLKTVKVAGRLMALDAALGDAVDEIGAHLKGAQANLAAFKAEAAALASATAAIQAKLAGVDESIGKTADVPARTRLEADRKSLVEQQAAFKVQAGIVQSRVAQAQDIVDVISAWQAKFTQHRTALETFLSGLGAADSNGVPKLVSLVKAELLQAACFPGDTGTMADRANASDLRLVNLRIVQRPQSTVQKTYAFARRYYANALVSIEYRVAPPDGRIFAEGVITRSSSERLRMPERAN